MARNKWKGETGKLVREARKNGWVVTATARNHVRMQHETGAIVYAPGTPSDVRNTRNVEAQMRRALRSHP